MTLGRQLAKAFADKDHAAVRALLADDVDFKALTPGRSWDAGTPDAVLEVLFSNWLESHDIVEALVGVVDGEDVGDTHHVSYRLHLRTPRGPHVMEQQAYYRTDGARLSYLRVMCSGFRPRPEGGPG